MKVPVHPVLLSGKSKKCAEDQKYSLCRWHRFPDERPIEPLKGSYQPFYVVLVIHADDHDALLFGYYIANYTFNTEPHEFIIATDDKLPEKYYWCELPDIKNLPLVFNEHRDYHPFK